MPIWLLTWTGLSPVNSIGQFEKSPIRIKRYGGFLFFFHSKGAYEVTFRLLLNSHSNWNISNVTKLICDIDSTQGLNRKSFCKIICGNTSHCFSS